MPPAAVLDEDTRGADDSVGDVELDPETNEEELEDEDEIGDDELQSMLQDDDSSAGAITDTANTDWYMSCARLLKCQALCIVPISTL